MSPAPDSTLEPQQLIAELQRQLAEVVAERDEALEQQTATAEVLGVINSSPGNLTPVFDAMLEKAMRLCEAAFGHLDTYDGNSFHTSAIRGVPAAYAEYRRNNPPNYGPGTGPARMLAGERIVHHLDMMDEEAYRWGEQNRRALVDLGGARSAINVALVKDRTFLGFITLFRQEVRPFSDKQIALLENFAAQAVIAIENARLITETREALEQQTATAEVLGVINSSPGDLAPVFGAVLEKALRICGAAFGILSGFDGEGFPLLAAHGVPETYLPLARLRRPLPGMPLARLTLGEALVHIEDITAGAGYRSGNPREQVVIEQAGARTAVWVALCKDEVLLGALTIYRTEVRRFTDKQIALLENFAAQAVIAMENARLITETREALEQQTATAEVLQVINSSPGDLAPVFDALLDKALRLCEASYGMLITWDGERLRRSAFRGASVELMEALGHEQSMPQPGGVADRLLRGENIIYAADITQDPSFARAPRVQTLARVGGARSYIAVPLRKDDRLLGFIGMYRREVRSFSEKEIALLQNFAAQAVIAMENARLITETREALEQQTATAEVLQVINSSPGDLAPVFDAMLDKAMRLCGAAFGVMGIRDGDQSRSVAVRGVPSALTEFRRHNPSPPTAPIWSRLLKGEPFIHTIDLKQEEAYESGDPQRRALVDLGGARTSLAVTLMKDRSVLGAIHIYRQEVHPFTDKQIALLQNFAAQAVIAIENARLITETREALEQQTATAEVLGVINSSPGDLAPVFDAMLEKTLRLCEAAHGNFLTYDGEVFHGAAFRGEPQFAEYRRQQGPLEPHAGGQLARMVQGGGTLHRIDARESEAYRDDPGFRRMVDGLGIRTSLAVPLRKGDALLGVVRAYRQEVRPFTDKQIALVENFAAQAVIAMENARLLGELRQRTDEVAELNRGLEARVAEQVDELGRVGRLKRFLAPQLAELIVSQGDEKILESHRREIVVVFCDLRGYTAFTETAEPEEVLNFLREYHGALGPLVSQFEGTLDQFSGDGIMVFFNDPVPCADPAERAVKMAVAMRSAANTLIADWRERGRDLGFGAGIAQGYATLGQIGFSERSGYTAIGTVCNVAARLCAEAKDGQILLGQLVNVALKGSVATEQLGPLTLKGLSQPVVAYNVPLGANQPALRVIEGAGSDSI